MLWPDLVCSWCVLVHFRLVSGGHCAELQPLLRAGVLHPCCWQVGVQLYLCNARVGHITSDSGDTNSASYGGVGAKTYPVCQYKTGLINPVSSLCNFNLTVIAAAPVQSLPSPS